MGKKRNSSIVAAFMCALFLLMSGCSSPAASVSSDNSVESPSDIDQSVVSLSDIFSSDDPQIWYGVDEIGKDADIKTLYAIENGTISVYSFHDYKSSPNRTLGALSKISDEAFLNQVENDLANGSYDSRYCVIDASPQLYLFTDKTGNNVASEGVLIGPDAQEYYEKYYLNNPSGKEHFGHSGGTGLLFTGETSKGIVYDDMWVGYDVAYQNVTCGRYFITRNNPSDSYILDSFDTPNVVIQ